MNEHNEKICRELEALGFHELTHEWVAAMRTGLQLVYDSGVEKNRKKTEEMSKLKIHHMGVIVLSNLLKIAINKNDRPILIYQRGDDDKWTITHEPLIHAISNWVPGKPNAVTAFPEMTLKHSEYVVDPIHRIGCGIIFGDFKFAFPIEAALEDTILSPAEFQKLHLGGGSPLTLPDRRNPLNPPTPIRVNGRVTTVLEKVNRLGVTTQVPSQITIRGAGSTRSLKIGDLEVQFLRQGNVDADYRKPEITDILESVRLIKNTPDRSPERVLAKVTSVLKRMPSRERINLIHLLSNERPFVRAILGALLEGLGVKAAQEIKSTLNAMTGYKIGIKKMPFPKMKEWRIS